MADSGVGHPYGNLATQVDRPVFAIGPTNIGVAVEAVLAEVVLRRADRTGLCPELRSDKHVDGIASEHRDGRRLFVHATFGVAQRGDHHEFAGFRTLKPVHLYPSSPRV